MASYPNVDFTAKDMEIRTGEPNTYTIIAVTSTQIFPPLALVEKIFKLS